jgi:hypothetical protein
MQQQLTRANTPWQQLQFTLTDQISYINENFEPNEITRKVKLPGETLEGTEDWHSNAGSHLRVDGPGPTTPVSP